MFVDVVVFVVDRHDRLTFYLFLWINVVIISIRNEYCYSVVNQKTFRALNSEQELVLLLLLLQRLEYRSSSDSYKL